MGPTIHNNFCFSPPFIYIDLILGMIVMVLSLSNISSIGNLKNKISKLGKNRLYLHSINMVTAIIITLTFLFIEITDTFIYDQSREYIWYGFEYIVFIKFLLDDYVCYESVKAIRFRYLGK